MGLEDAGVRLVAQDEAQFKAAMTRAQQSVDKFDKSVDAAEKTTKKSASSTDVLSKAFDKLGKIAAGAFAVDKVVDFIKSAISSASDMNETLSKSQVVFGDLSGSIEEMGNTAAKSMGISKQEAISAAATYGNLFTAMGLGKEPSAEMSARLVQLASDLASFNNIPVADALEKLRAGLVGESEPLKSLGINLNETTLKAKALELGLSDGKEVLTASAKAQAAYAIMLEQSTTAQGDFARTADGVANKQRTLEATTKDLTASIGKGLIPAWQGVLNIMNDALFTIDQAINGEEKLRQIVLKHEKDVRKSAGSWEDYNQEMLRAIAASKGFSDLRDFETWAKFNLVSIPELVKSYGLLDEATFNAIKMEQEWGTEADRGAGANYRLKASLDATVVSAEQLEEEQNRIKTTMSEVALFMSGPVGKENEKYISDINSARAALDTTESKMKDLLKIKGPWTPDQQRAYSDLLSAQAVEKAKIEEIEKAHDKAMKTILANMLLTKLSYGGLTQEESDFYIKTISDWGLIDQATVNAWNEVDTYIARLNGAEAAAGKLKTAVDQIPASKTVTITVKETTKKYLEEGEPTSQPKGEPGWGTGGTGGARASGGPVQAGVPYLVGSQWS